MAAVLTLAGARTVLYNALNDAIVNALPTVAQVFDHDPILSDQEPLLSVMGLPGIVTMFATGVDPDWWQFTVKVFLSMSTDRPESAQKSFDEIIDTLVAAIDDDGRIGPSQWTLGTNDARDALTAESVIQVGREDF